MDTFLLTWNPARGRWSLRALERDVEALRRRGFVDRAWSCGTTTQMPRGSRVFLLRQGPRDGGLVGAGRVTREPRPTRPRADPGRTAPFVGVRWEHLSGEPLIGRDELDRGPLRAAVWRTRRSGVRLDPVLCPRLEAVWDARVSAAPLSPDEVVPSRPYSEGQVRRITVDARERSPRAKAACLAHHGPACCVCRMTFERAYGTEFKGLIHVHHLVPLSTGRRARRVDPVRDLRPVCPNCHAALHRRSPPYTPAELRRRLGR